MVDADEIARRNAVRIMDEQGVSQAELVRRAQAAGHTFDTATCNKVLRGRQPIRGHLEKVADGLSVSLSTLLEEGDNTDPVPPPPSEGEGEE